MKQMSLRQGSTEKQICSLRRDHCNVGDWSIMTDGFTVWISKQKIGHERTDHIQIPKRVFDKLFDQYAKPTAVGVWNNNKFKIVR